MATGFAATSGPAAAHSFVVAIRAIGEDRPAVLASAVQGFLLATTERDGHADEDSNGHLGGPDVYILPQPTEDAAEIAELKVAPYGQADITVAIGPTESLASDVAEARTDTTTMPPGTLPAERIWADDSATNPESFGARYRAAFARAPDRWAAEGYDAARRIDLAIRSLRGVDDRAALAEALESTAAGITW